MSSIVPRRLYRALQPTGPLFQLAVGGDTYSDDEITSVTIKRGGQDSGGGITPSTLEVQLPSRQGVASGAATALDLTSYGADLLATLCGVSASQVRARFAGRVGRQTITDEASRSTKAGRQTTTMKAASWTAQLSHVNRTYACPKSQGVATMLTNLLTSPMLPAMTAPSIKVGGGELGFVAAAQDITFRDLDKWTTTIGVTIRETRAGARQILGHAQRNRDALAALDTVPPLTRSQALSPATWEQPSEVIPENQHVKWGSTAPLGYREQTFGDYDNPNVPVADHDLTHVYWSTTNDAQPVQEGYRLRATLWDKVYRLPSVTVDLLYLVTSPRDYHRAQAAYLLALEVGDPVYLSGDWHSNLRGICYAVGIDERITGTKWELTLSLASSYATTGFASPDVPARVWDSSTYQWNQDMQSWDQH